MCGGVGEPNAVVRYASAHALAGMRQPPVLDVALHELAARGSEQVLSSHRRPDRGQGHAVLQLVPETVGAAGLVKRRSGPDAAGERLVDKPSVEHDICLLYTSPSPR